MKALDKRKKLSHHEVWEVIEGFYSNFPNEELDAMPTTMKRWDFFEGFQVDAESPEDFDEMTVEDLYLLHEFLLKKYREAFRNNKTSDCTTITSVSSKAKTVAKRLWPRTHYQMVQCYKASRMIQTFLVKTRRARKGKVLPLKSSGRVFLLPRTSSLNVLSK